jgi:hypothetical protein
MVSGDLRLINFNILKINPLINLNFLMDKMKYFGKWTVKKKNFREEEGIRMVK